MPDADTPAPHKETLRDTMISIIIAFAMAFVARGFVIEAFVIPTGSMAPTLLGAHHRYQGTLSGSAENDYAGYSWNLNPVGPNPGPVPAHDPMTGQRVTQNNPKGYSGDRILVQKYLYLLHEPSRYDVIVFKEPRMPQTNFIKRLIGLPGEELALVDGDVFTRTVADGEPRNGSHTPWTDKSWHIARKPDLVQRTLWQPVYDSQYAPINAASAGSSFTSPWQPIESSGHWDLSNPRTPTLTSPTESPAVLAYDGQNLQHNGNYALGGLNDYYPYDQHVPHVRIFPVSDLRLRMGYEPTTDEPATIIASLLARGYQFQAVIDGTAATLRMRPAPLAEDQPSNWIELASVQIDPIETGRVTNVEFWHADQQLSLWVDDEKVLSATYGDPGSPLAWTPADRVEHATGLPLDDVMLGAARSSNPLGEPDLYRQPSASFAFAGPAFTLHRVGVDRDIFYQPGFNRNGPSRATHPETTVKLTNDQFFVCGDNSPASSDSRLWGTAIATGEEWNELEPGELYPERITGVSPWVASQIDATPGVVPRQLLLGKAFFVYFPSLHKNNEVPIVPDFGNMRFIY